MEIRQPFFKLEVAPKHEADDEAEDYFQLVGLRPNSDQPTASGVNGAATETDVKPRRPSETSSDSRSAHSTSERSPASTSFSSPSSFRAVNTSCRTGSTSGPEESTADQHVHLKKVSNSSHINESPANDRHRRHSGSINSTSNSLDDLASYRDFCPLATSSSVGDQPPEAEKKPTLPMRNRQDDDIIIEELTSENGIETSVDVKPANSALLNDRRPPNSTERQRHEDIVIDSDDADSDDDLMVEATEPATAPEGRHGRDFCKFCDKKILDQKHWNRHVNTSFHKTQEEQYHHRDWKSEREDSGYEQNRSGVREKDDEEVNEDDDQPDYTEYYEEGDEGTNSRLLTIADPVFTEMQTTATGTQYSCTYCQVTCSSLIPYYNHVQGKKHKRKMKEHEMLKGKQAESCVTRDLETTFMEDARETGEPYVGLHLIQETRFGSEIRYNCQLCGKANFTPHDLGSHVKSICHRKKFVERFSPNSLGAAERRKLKTDAELYREAAKQALKRIHSNRVDLGIVRVHGNQSDDLKRIIREKMRKKEIVARREEEKQRQGSEQRDSGDDGRDDGARREDAKRRRVDREGTPESGRIDHRSDAGRRDDDRNRSPPGFSSPSRKFRSNHQMIQNHLAGSSGQRSHRF